MKDSSVLIRIAVTILLSFSTLVLLIAQPTVIEVSGDITENTTWADDTVKVTGDVVVDENITLSIMPGTWIRFQGNFGIVINGYLLAEGMPDDTIVFTRMDTLGFKNYASNDGGWKGLEFTEGGDHLDTSRLSLCKVSFVKCIEKSYGAITLNGTHNLIIRKCIIENNFGQNGGGIYMYGAQGASLLVRDSYIQNNFSNQHGGGIYGSYDTRILNNVITDNHALQWGGGIYLGYCDGEISGNTITNNYAEYSGGGLNNRYGSPLIKENLFSNNRSESEGGDYVVLIIPECVSKITGSLIIQAVLVAELI